MEIVICAFAIPLVRFHASTISATVQQARPAFVVSSTADAVDANLTNNVCATAENACTLRAAVQQANAAPGADAITVLTGTYRLSIADTDEQAAKGDLDLTGDLTISGVSTGTVTIDVAQIDRIFDVYNATVTLENLTLIFGRADGDGGTIYNRGTLMLNDIRIHRSTATNRGGGIFNAATGTVIVNSSDLYLLKASSGGAIWNAGSMQVIDSSLFENTAQGGGAIANDGTLMIRRCLLKSNSGYSGGAILQGSGSLTLQTSTVDSNTASYGGGFQIDSDGFVTIESSTLSNNTASQGGGIFNNGTLHCSTAR